ncbi:flavoprotein-like protein [Baffinella frigidus]|nr:flavoprotein-like protein [Cryptophyta sp. CCMP2293]
MPKVNVLFGGELAQEVAERLVTEGKDKGVEMVARDMADFKGLKLDEEPSVSIFVVQTVENDEAPESSGACIRFLKRKTHPADHLAGKMSFSVLAVGDSNLLLDRQTTTAKDCNKVGQGLDVRLAEIGGTRFHPRGEADERTGLQEVEPWIEGLWPALLALA